MCARVTEELLTRCDHVLAQWMVETALLSHCITFLTRFLTISLQDQGGKKMFLTKLMLSSSGEKDIPGLTDTTVPRRLGPKRASKIRKLFNLAKEDDVRQYVVRRPLNKEGETLVFLNNGIMPSFFFF